MSNYTIFLDIETIPGPVPPDLSDIPVPGSMKKEETIAKWRTETAPDLLTQAWAKESLESLKGRVCAVGFASGDDPVECVINGREDGESGLLAVFESKLKSIVGRDSFPVVNWVGFNIKEFDLKWIRHRAYKYGLKLLKALCPWEKYSKQVIDLREILDSGYQAKGTFDQYCKWLGLSGKPEGMDGSKIWSLWNKKDFEAIRQYCMNDVENVRALYHKIF